MHECMTGTNILVAFFLLLSGVIVAGAEKRHKVMLKKNVKKEKQ